MDENPEFSRFWLRRRLGYLLKDKIDLLCFTYQEPNLFPISSLTPEK